MAEIVKELTSQCLNELLEELQVNNHRLKSFKIYEEEGIRYLSADYYIRENQKKFVSNESAKNLAIISLRRYASKEILGLVENYECEYNYQKNTFIETSSYSGTVDSQHEKVQVLKEKLDELKAYAEQLHLDGVMINQLGIHDGKRKRNVNFIETIDCLIETLTC